MEAEHHGSEETQEQHAQGQADGQAQHAQEEVNPAANTGSGDYKALLAKQEARIKELEGQVAEAAQSKANADKLSAEIEQMKAQAADERVEFQLKLAGVRNVKAAKALLDEHDGDVSALKATEPWLFENDSKQDKKQTGTTGLEPAGASGCDDTQLRRWERIAGLTDDE